MKIAILGFGREGQSLLSFFKKDKQLRNAEIWVLDRKENLRVPDGIKRRLGRNYLQNLKEFNIVFRSPGIPYNLTELKKARTAGVKFSSASKLFFDRCPAKIIGVTGTKGKGTTSTILYKILKAAHRKVFLAGNIGKSTLAILPQIKKSDLAILELSSFQLQDLQKSPQIAVILNVFPDHQDAHKNLKEYYEAKANIAKFQKSADKLFYFKNNRLSRWIAQKGRGRKFAVDENEFNLFRPKDLKIKGIHNFQNAVIAATVAKNLGVPTSIVVKTIRNFHNLPHRLELVRVTRDPKIHLHLNKALRDTSVKSRSSSQIEFYDDSASTNPQTTAAALKAFPGKKKILIAGGQDKRLDYKPLTEVLLKNSGTELIVLFGENKRKMNRQITKSKTRIILAKNLKMAVKTAYRFAKRLPKTRLPIIIIFSPGAASFDMFKNYVDRGEQFKSLVKNLAR